MNRKQKFCLWTGIAAFVFASLFPPIFYDLEYYNTPHPVDEGYWFLCTPPECPYQPGIKRKMMASIDFARLSVEWAIIAVVTGGLIVTFRDVPRR